MSYGNLSVRCFPLFFAVLADSVRKMLERAVINIRSYFDNRDCLHRVLGYQLSFHNIGPISIAPSSKLSSEDYIFLNLFYFLRKLF